jgi:hypothetical protein
VLNNEPNPYFLGYGTRFEVMVNRNMSLDLFILN